MIKAIIFDFDGVIIESANIKTEAFKELFFDYPAKIKEIVDYHSSNAGISRYVKFRYIYDRILRKELTKEREVELGERFSQLTLRKILEAHFVAGIEEFLDKNKRRYQFFIASGIPEPELRNIINLKKLQEYFREIHGSPKEKTDIINEIIRDYSLNRDEVVYVGDSQSDCIAAEKAKIFFIRRDMNSNTNSLTQPWVIKDFLGLEGVLEKIKS